MRFHSLPQCQRCKGYVSRTSSLHSVASVCWAGLSAPFSSHSCLIVFIQRAPGSHSPGPLAVASSPPALEHLLPAPVYLALMSKPHLYKPTQQQITEKSLKSSNCCNVSGLCGVAERSTNGLGCMGCSQIKCPGDVTLSVLWVILLIQLIFGIILSIIFILLLTYFSH